MFRIVLFFSFFVFCSCSTVNIDVIQSGPYFPPKKDKDIKLYTDKNGVEYPFGAVAILHSDKFDCSVKKQKQIISLAKKKAAETGANGIIYYFDFGEKDPYALPEEKCYFSGLAIKYIDEEAKKYLVETK